MAVKLLVLFFTPLLSGLFIYFVPRGRNASYKMLLVFAGSYLFAITVTHILPELYRQYGQAKLIGIFVLAGFFLQQVLEYFATGIEHGHIHTNGHHDHHHHEHASGQHVSAFILLLALCLHAFLEGGMLAQPLNGKTPYDVNAILIGIVLHRAPAAFALMAVLMVQLGSRNKALPYLLIFSLAAPLGLLVSGYLVNTTILSEMGLIYLYALVSGNFLHISTTIVFESNPDHRFNAKKLIVAVIGAAAAVVAEYFM